MFRSTFLSVLVMAVGLGMVGCQGAKQPQSQGLDIQDTHEVQLVVRNYNWQSMSIHVFSSQGRKKLGILSSQGEEVFVLGSVQQLMAGRGTITLLADPVGGGQPWAQELHTLSRGDIIEWTVGQPLFTSSIMVY